MKGLPAEEIDALVNLVRRAGDAILEVYGEQFEIEKKDDDSPLTEADLRSHRLLVEGLQALTPALPIVSEESSLPAWSKRRNWNRYWLIDPLDGTKEFVNRNGEFTVNVALIDEGRAVIGVVGVPVRGDVYVGDVAKKRAERRGKDDSVVLATRALDRSRPLAVVASRSHGGDRLESFIASLGVQFSAVERTPIGSSLKLCVLAEGKADLYPRLGPTSEWDIAAAQAVLESAGGVVATFDRAPLRYNTKESFLNPEFVAIADPRFDWWRVLPDPAGL